MESNINTWQELNNTLTKTFVFKDFVEAINFINEIAKIANELDHHPEINNIYNKVSLTLTTHDKGNQITEKDKEFAKRVDGLDLTPFS